MLSPCIGSSATEIPYGYCQCGCGGEAPTAKKTDSRLGAVKGKPRKFIMGHQRRKSSPAYTEVDLGYGSPCWIWQRHKVPNSYGQLKLSSGSLILAHRYYYERVYGEIPDGAELDHLCRSRACVNPEHLEVVDSATNVRRGKAAKLKWWQVVEIRRRYQAGEANQYQLAREHGVSQSTIYRVLNHDTWKARLESAGRREDG